MLRKLINNYLTELKLSGKSKYTVINYQKHLEKFATWSENNGIAFLQIDGKESKRFRNYLVEQELSPKTVNTIVCAVKSFYDFLVEEGFIIGNPWLTKRLRVTEEKRTPNFLTEAEEKRVLSAIEKFPYHVSLALKTMLAAGLRVSEVANLKPDDVIIHQGKILVWIQQGKGKKDSYAPITNAFVANELIEFAKGKEGNKLFGITDGTLKVYAHIVKKKTGIDFHTHRCRHTLATRLLAKGTPIDVVQDVLGHVDISTTRKYAATLPEKIMALAADVGN